MTMRSTFIVGFPGESEEHVAYLEEWLGRAELDRVGFFAFSREEGTPSAGLQGQVPAREKNRRLLRLRESARQASQRSRARRVGETVRVLVEERRQLRGSHPMRARMSAANAWIGRSMGEAPGVDGAIYFTGETGGIGSFTDVTLKGTGAFDFFGTQVSVPSLEAVVG
jgi:ribosomal protein S12 methylthiotransferase